MRPARLYSSNYANMTLLYNLQMNNNQSFLRRMCIYVYVNVEHTELTAVLCVTPTQALQGRDIKQMLSSLIIFTHRLTVTQAGRVVRRAMGNSIDTPHIALIRGFQCY